MALNTSFFYFIILWKGHADVMVDGPLGLEGLRPDGPKVLKGLKFDSGYAAEGCCRAPLNYRRRQYYKTIQPPFGRGNASPLWWLAPDGQAPVGLEGSGASRRPGSIVRVLRTERWVRPTERAGSEGSFICRCPGQRKPLQQSCGCRKCMPPLVAGATTFPPRSGGIIKLCKAVLS